jgi:hypothetical protein
VGRFVLLLLFLGCSQPEDSGRKPELQEYIDRTLAEDRRNKEQELQYLEEIRIAQTNNDNEAFQFFLDEYLKVPRMDIPEWMKEEPNYFEGGDRVKY